MKKVLIVGLGIGRLYQKILTDTTQKHLFDVSTIDPDITKNADFLDLEHCFDHNDFFDLVIVCCPNHLHSYYVTELIMAGKCGTILVEKPGLPTASDWALAVASAASKGIRLIMVKNNYYRIDLLKKIRETIYDNKDDVFSVGIEWRCKDRIPNPGSWFTNKALAGGGVGKDLMPHLINIYLGIFKIPILPESCYLVQQHSLNDITNTEYGTIVINDPIYDVDDTALMILMQDDIRVSLIAAWKDPVISDDSIGVKIIFKNSNSINYDFGLCPEKYYYDMILDILKIGAHDPLTDKEHFDIDYTTHLYIDELYNHGI